MLKDGTDKIYRKNVKQSDVSAKRFLHGFPGAISKCSSETETRNVLYHYASELVYSSGIKPIRLYKNSGWIQYGSYNVYVTADGVAGHPELPVRAESELCIRDNVGVGMMNGIITQMFGVIRERWKGMGLLLYVMMQYLHTVFERAGAVPKFSLFVGGARGCRKTAVCQCITQLVHKDTPPINFLATEAGIQEQLTVYSDQCMLIDDLAPSANGAEKKQREKKLEMILRLFGDAGGRVINRSSASKLAEQADYSVHGGAVITGEYFYSTGSESSIARAVVIELDRDSVNLDVLTWLQNNPAILESLLYRLIVFVTNHYDQTLNIIKGQVLYYREYASKLSFINSRYADYLGQYMAIGYIVAEMLVLESKITQAQYQQFVNGIQEGIIQLLLENNEKMKQRTPINTILSALLYAMNCGKIGAWGNQFSAAVRLVKKDDTLYFRQMDLSDITKEYCQKYNISCLKMSSTEIGKVLYNSGLFSRHGSERRLGKRYTNFYGTARLIDIPLDVLLRYGEDYRVDL